MSTEPEHGHSLTPHGGSLADPSVPERAGAIVSEVITSIAEETRQRADELRAEAEKDAREEVASAREASGRIRGCMNGLADKLGDLRSGIAREEDLLSNSLGRLSAGPGVRAIPPPRSEPEREPGAFVHEAVADAEVVEEEGVAPEQTAATEEPPVAEEAATTEGPAAAEDAATADEPETSDEPEASDEPAGTDEPAAATVDIQADDSVRAEIAKMSDSELSATYVDALRLASERTQAGMDPSRANAVAEAVVEEAHKRPGFAEPDAPARGFRARVASVTGRHVVTPRERLREAVRKSQA